MNKKINNELFVKTYTKNLNQSEFIPNEFNMTENLYKKTVKILNNSDLSNSSTRYISELTQVKNLKQLAQKYNLTEKLDYYSSIEDEILIKLKNLGFEMK